MARVAGARVVSGKALSTSVAEHCHAINALVTKLDHAERKVDEYQRTIGQHNPPAALVLDRKKLAAFSAAAARFLLFPFGDRRCNRTRASASKRPVTRAQALTNATLAAAGLLHRRSPTAPCSKGLEAEVCGSPHLAPLTPPRARGLLAGRAVSETTRRGPSPSHWEGQGCASKYDVRLGTHLA